MTIWFTVLLGDPNQSAVVGSCNNMSRKEHGSTPSNRTNIEH